MKVPVIRSQIPVNETWNLDDLFHSHSDWDAAFESLDDDRTGISLYQGKLGHGSATLLECLDAVQALHERAVRVFTYAHLRNAEDGTNPQHQAGAARIAALSARLGASIAFVDSEILQLPDGVIERYLTEEPALASYSVFLHDLLEVKPHQLGAEAEQVLASIGEVLRSPGMVYNRSKSSDIQFASFTDTTGIQYPNSFNLYESTYEGHADVGVRRGAWKSFGDGLKAYNNTYAATFATEVNKNVVLARLRKYVSTEEFLLQQHKVPVSLYNNVLQIILREVAPHMQRYARLRRRVLGLDKLLYCDIKAPMDPGYDPSISYDEACALILDSLAVMGTEYCQYAQTAMSQRWVDRGDNIGKSSGAFCASPFGVHPYILVTWANSMRSVFILTHELGHGGHFSLAMRHQRLINMRPAMPFVEAPSIMNEMLLAQHILAKHDDPRMRRSVIMQVLGTYHHNFVTHLLEAELLRQVYAKAESGQSITAAFLNQVKGEILAKFWGDTVEIDDAARMTWMRQPHYYLGLYPYTYSVSLVASTAMARRIHEHGDPAVQQWLEVLKAGGTLRPLELMQAAGIDMATPGPIHDAAAYVGMLVDELEHGFV